MLNRLAELFNEPVMGFLALVALSSVLAPALFELPSGIMSILAAANWAVVALFVIEYAANCFLSADKWRFACEPWRILDAVIIIIPILSLLPFVAPLVLSSPSLRMLRLIRVVLFAPRVEHGLHRASGDEPDIPSVGIPQITLLRAEEKGPRSCEWKDLLQLVSMPSGEWVHASNLSPESLFEIAEAVGIPHLIIEAALQETGFPRMESGTHWTALTIALISESDPVRRDPVLLLIFGNGLLSLSTHAVQIQNVPVPIGTLPWGPRCALSIVSLVLARDERLVARLERKVRQLEEVPAVENPDGFFKQVVHLKRALSVAKGDLWRLRGLLEMLADGRRKLPAMEAEQRTLIEPMVDEADYLYETVDNVRESVLSVIELHLDLFAHDTNRFMRLMAIVSTLALIPAVVGGLLGMNLAGAPWPVSFGQVAFGSIVLAIAVLYTFMAKGWIRSR